jgi:hypothetical protein
MYFFMPNVRLDCIGGFSATPIKISSQVFNSLAVGDYAFSTSE